MGTCEECGRTLAQGATRCGNCGARVEQYIEIDPDEPPTERTCAVCSEGLRPRDRLCPFCGTKVREVSPPPASRPVESAPRSSGVSRWWIVAVIIVIAIAARAGLRSSRTSHTPTKPRPASYSYPQMNTLTVPARGCAVYAFRDKDGCVLAQVQPNRLVDFCVADAEAWDSLKESERDQFIDLAIKRGHGVSETTSHACSSRGRAGQYLVVRNPGSGTITVSIYEFTGR